MTGGPLALNIAWRYITAPKSHGAVSAIALISIVGVAVATAAIVIVLSVFNGFKLHLNARLNSLSPDITISAAYGKTFPRGDSLANAVEALNFVDIAMAEVADNALLLSGTKEMPVTLRGVYPQVFSRITSIDSLLLDGNPVGTYTPGEASISVGVAQNLGIYSAGQGMLLFAPKRIGRVNMANPSASFLTDSITASSVFRSLQNEIDENTVITDISTARKLFQYETEATGLLVNLIPGYDLDKGVNELQGFLGEDYTVKDRIRQQEVNFRMVEIEKWLTFSLLSFILIIASFNIISTICMIVLDKGDSLVTLFHLGLKRHRVGNIFWWESLIVTSIGAAAGIIVGVVLSLIQERFELIKLAGDPENLVILAYPVKVEFLDILATLVPLAIIGIICAAVSHTFACSRLKTVG